MSDERLIVLDTNVIVSAFLMQGSKARQAFDKAQRDGLVLMSAPVLAELEAVLARPKFDRYVTVTERKMLLAAFVKTVKFVQIEETIEVCRDPKDDKYLELAVTGKSCCIVTGDVDLLVLHPFRDVSILTIQIFLDS